jgi:hypothetical protein
VTAVLISSVAYSLCHLVYYDARQVERDDLEERLSSILQLGCATALKRFAIEREQVSCATCTIQMHTMRSAACVHANVCSTFCEMLGLCACRKSLNADTHRYALLGNVCTLVIIIQEILPLLSLLSCITLACRNTAVTLAYATPLEVSVRSLLLLSSTHSYSSQTIAMNCAARRVLTLAKLCCTSVERSRCAHSVLSRNSISSEIRCI